MTNETALEKKQLAAWQSIRSTIGNFDNLVIRLLIQATILLFLALGVITSYADALETTITIVLTLGLAFGTTLFTLGVFFYTALLEDSVKAAKQIECKLFKNNGDELKISHLLDKRLLAAGRWGGYYYRIWVSMLAAGTWSFALWQLCKGAAAC